MSATTFGWLVLLFPLLGTLIIAFGFRTLPGRYAGWIGTAAIGLAFVAALGALIAMQGHSPSHRELESSLWDYAATVGIVPSDTVPRMSLAISSRDDSQASTVSSTTPNCSIRNSAR